MTNGKDANKRIAEDSMIVKNKMQKNTTKMMITSTSEKKHQTMRKTTSSRCQKMREKKEKKTWIRIQKINGQQERRRNRLIREKISTSKDPSLRMYIICEGEKI